MKNKIILTILVTPLILFDMTISGFLKEKRSNEPLVEGNIYIENKNIGTVSNIDGFYAISNLESGKYTIIYQYLGYKKCKKEIEILPNKNKTLNIYLERDSEQLDEIVVYAEKDFNFEIKENPRSIKINSVRIEPQKMKYEATLIQPDLFRTTQTLSGVATTSDYSTDIYVRGANRDHNLILHDGATVYNPSHLFGLFSSFIPEALRNINMVKSSSPVEYGGRVGAVLDVSSKDGNSEEFDGNISLSILNSSTAITGPVYKGGFLFAGRRTYLDPILSLIDDKFNYSFYDAHFQIYQNINEKSKIIFSSYFGNDNLEQNLIDFGWGNRAFSLRLKSILSPKLYSSLNLSYSKFFLDQMVYDRKGDPMEGVKEELFKFNNKIEDYSAKNKYEYTVSKDIEISFGLDFKTVKIRYDSEDFSDDLFSLNYSSKLIETALFSTFSKTFNNKFTLLSGVRYNIDYIDSEKIYNNYSPLLSCKYIVDKTSSLNLSIKKSYQNLYSFRIDNFDEFGVNPINLWLSIDKEMEQTESFDISLGYNYNNIFWGDIYKFSFETYGKYIKNFYFADILDYENGDSDHHDFLTTSNIKSYGLEFNIKKITGKVIGSLSYTFSRSFQVLNNKRYPTIWDIPNSLKINSIYKLSERNNIGVTLNYNSGRAYTSAYGGYFNQFFNGEPINPELIVVKSKLYGNRYPSYFRIDLSYNHRWLYNNGTSLLINCSLLNISFHKNIQSYKYVQNWFYDEEEQQEKYGIGRNENLMLPIIPSIRVEYKF
ncbi:MAG: hypothetical protein CR982_06790 [Candidatus Cloacimonadota bacterium]|nr:MAG: hypothetical protein CR982_06790 [Candidatus Cloacimonadota bacterium]PIE77810.1 MAG: hypothetical protein CSA15_10975 [Candidatus Delongbacteria bacterium]